MKFFSYNFLNEALNNSDVMHGANTVFNKVPNCNDATRIAINVRLTILGAQQLSMVVI